MELSEKVTRALNKAQSNLNKTQVEDLGGALSLSVEIPTFSHGKNLFNINYVVVYDKEYGELRYHIDDYASKARSDNHRVRYWHAKTFFNESGISEVFAKEIDENYMINFESKNEEWKLLHSKMKSKMKKAIEELKEKV